MLRFCKHTALPVSHFRFFAEESIRCYAKKKIGSVIPDPKIPKLQLYNEPLLTYLSGSSERSELQKCLVQATGTIEDIPIVIGDKEFRTKDVRHQVMPHNHQKSIAKFYYADRGLIERAIEVSMAAQKEWDRVPHHKRIDIWNRAADLMAGKYRQVLNAATMLGQSKTVIQAEIDASAELIDFIRMNAVYLAESLKYQPISENATITKNSIRHRGFDGFIAAISPFNFTAIGGNLAYTPALMGNGVLWKPSDTAILSNWVIFKIMREAGVPAGVVNFVPADGPVFGDTITASKNLAAINFTGSVPTFTRLWRQVGENLPNYVNFPRLIGECGGKNFHFVHPTADVESVATSTIRSAFEYNGQKCSACSRAYIPMSQWEFIKKRLLELRDGLKIGDVTDFSAFASAVIDDKAFARIKSYIDYAHESAQVEVLGGGKYDDSKGYFIEPTIVKCNRPDDKLITEEIFGPVLSIYLYDDEFADSALDLVDRSTKFALTGAIYAQDKKFLDNAVEKLKWSAGNLYINDKSTGSIVGQQPFGGGRHSGTNDKAGSPQYISRWSTPQSVKETFVPLRDVNYPYMEN